MSRCAVKVTFFYRCNRHKLINLAPGTRKICRHNLILQQDVPQKPVRGKHPYKFTCKIYCTSNNVDIIIYFTKLYLSKRYSQKYFFAHGNLFQDLLDLWNRFCFFLERLYNFSSTLKISHQTTLGPYQSPKKGEENIRNVLRLFVAALTTDILHIHGREDILLRQLPL